MKRRVYCFLLSVLVVFSLIPAMAFGASAASSLTTSEEGIALIKKFEGFVPYPMADYSQYSIGYGTRCPDDKLAYYRAKGITTKEADELLREHLAKDEKRLNAFADKFGLTLTQQRFDALMSFTYNFGADWMNNASTFRTAVINGVTGNDFIFAITQWCNAADEVKTHLIRRRLIEANVYLNGDYTNVTPANYKYVIYDNNGGNSTIKVQGYAITEKDEVRSVPTYSGYRFLGWYTAKESGKWITQLDSTTAGLTLYAHWQKDEGNLDEDGAILGTAASYERYVSAGQVVREVPKISGEILKTLESGQTVSITADYVDGNHVKWGKLSSGGWINLSQSDLHAPDTEDSEAVNVTVTVTSSFVNIRTGAGTDNELVRRATKGEQMVITQVKTVGGAKWGKFDGGWICLSYTNFETALAEASPDASVVTATGTVTVDGLRIRTGTSTGTDIVGTLNKGDKVTITLQQTVGVMHWGRIDRGWICLDYVDLTPVDGDQTAEAPDAEEDKEETPDQEGSAAKPDDNQTSDPVVIATGTVYNCNTLRIRAGAGTKYPQAGSLANGTRVEIFEQTTVNGQPWGRIAQGWICLSYVKLDLSEEEQENAQSYVVLADKLNVRSGPGTHNAKVGSLAKGTKVLVLETTKVGSKYWARIEQGWVHMDYLELLKDGADQPETPDTSDKTETPDQGDTPQTPGDSDSTGNTVIATGTIYRCDSLRIRERPGTKYEKVGSLANGARVEIYEFTMIGVSQWARIDQGWICMYYVLLDQAAAAPEETPSGDPDHNENTSDDKDTSDNTENSETVEVSLTGTIVKTDVLRVRGVPGVGNDEVGQLKRGDRVEILELTTVPGGAMWGRTSGGWIHMYYVQLDAANETVKVVNTDTLRIRDGAGVKYTQIGTYIRGQMVIILEETTVGDAKWGRTDKGWICLDYVV